MKNQLSAKQRIRLETKYQKFIAKLEKARIAQRMREVQEDLQKRKMRTNFVINFMQENCKVCQGLSYQEIYDKITNNSGYTHKKFNQLFVSFFIRALPDSTDFAI